MSPLYAFYFCCAGALGGACFHIYWLIDLLAKNKASKVNRTAEEQRLRLIKMGLSLSVGAAAGFMVGIWFSSEVKSHDMGFEKAIVVAYLAGLAGDSALSFLRRVASL